MDWVKNGPDACTKFPFKRLETTGNEGVIFQRGTFFPPAYFGKNSQKAV